MNKHLYTLIFVSIAILVVNAQERSFLNQALETKQTTHLKAKSDAGRTVLDTNEVFFPSWNDDCSNTLTGFAPNNAWGLVSGMNAFMDLAKAQQLEYTGTDSYRLLGGIGYFSNAVAVNNGMLKMDFYDLDESTGGPGNLLATTIPINVSSITLPDEFVEPTIFIIPPSEQPVVTDANFIASVDLSALYATLDTVYLWQTAIDCGDGSNTWELQSSPDSVWATILDAWQMNADFGITAIVDTEAPTSDQNFIASNGVTLYPAMPNPAQESVLLKFEIEASGPVQIDILDQTGKLVQRSKEQLTAGNHQREIRLDRYSAGVYYYVLATAKGNIASRFIVE